MGDQKSFIEDIANKKPESFHEEVFTLSKRNNKRIYIALAVLVVGILFIFLVKNRTTTLPDMTGWKLEDIQTWVDEKHKKTTVEGIYNLEYPAGIYISQDIPVGSSIKKKETFTIQYSLGGDQNESITLIDFKSLSVKEIEDWIKENQLTGVTIKYENSEVVQKDKVINYDIIDGTEKMFIRKNRITIFVSNGNEDLADTFKMPDFLGMNKGAVLQWGEDHEIKITIKKIFNPYIEQGKVFKQNIKKDTKITRKDKLRVDISLGSPITVPDFTGLTRGEATELAALHSIKVFLKHEASNQAFDTILSQNIEPGIQIDKTKILTLQIAGDTNKITVPDFVGLSANEATSLASLYAMKVFIKNIDGTNENSKVISQSIKQGKQVEKTKIITLNAEGETKELKVPDFINLTLEEANSLAALHNTKVFIKKVSSSKEKDIVFAQSKAKGKIIQLDDIITLCISTGQKKAPNFIGLTKNEASTIAQNKLITLIFNEIETTTAPNNTVIKQSIKKGQEIEGTITILLDIAINSGVMAKDLTYLSKIEAEDWANKNKIILHILDQYSDTHSVGILYDQSMKDKLIPYNGSITLYHSLGQVSVENFVNKTKLDIIKWKDEVNSKGGNILLTFLEDNNTTKAKGIITNQSVKSDLVKRNETIFVWVSVTDNGIIIPNLDDKSEAEFILWCNTNSVLYVITDQYSSSYRTGRVFGQNYNNSYVPKGEFLKIYRSLGSVIIKDFTNQAKSAVTSWLKQVNSLNASIKLVFAEEYSDTIGQGKIINQSVKDEEININDTITITISLGPKSIPTED